MSHASKKKFKKHKERRRLKKQIRSESYNSFKKPPTVAQRSYGTFLLYFLGALVVAACVFAFYNMK